MMWFLIGKTIGHYWFRAKRFVSRNWQWLVAAAVGAALLLAGRGSEDAAKRKRVGAKLRETLRTQEEWAEAYRRKSEEYAHRDLELVTKAAAQYNNVAAIKREIVELESGQPVDWLKLSDEEIDARFKKAGL